MQTQKIEDKIREKVKKMGDHALMNVVCSGNKMWSEIASEEYQWRVENKKHIIK